MKKPLSIILAVIIAMVCLCACDSNTDNTTQPTTDYATEVTEDIDIAQDPTEAFSNPIIGTWVCDDISKDMYFIFDEKGDAYAKWGTSTVYGYYDYYESENTYDIDVPNFLYNEYKAQFSGDKMTLTSEESSYTFERDTMPEITITAPDNLVVDDKLIGNWQCADNFECYEFRADGSATITDIYNYATIDCKYTCNNGKITFYYMSSDKKEGQRESEYSFSGVKLDLSGYIYENVTGQSN